MNRICCIKFRKQECRMASYHERHIKLRLMILYNPTNLKTTIFELINSVQAKMIWK